MTSRPRHEARERLLAAAMHYIAVHGVGELSLRQLAAALGTSHRMLIYHFDSKEGFLVEVVRAVEQHMREVLQKITAADTLTSAQVMRQMWLRLSDHVLSPYERLFFELYGQALQGRPHTTDLLDGIVESWLGPLEEIFRRAGAPAATARDDARLALAVTRGLLLDRLATGDKGAVDRAMERFMSCYEAALARSPVKPRSPGRRSRNKA